MNNTGMFLSVVLMFAGLLSSPCGIGEEDSVAPADVETISPAPITTVVMPKTVPATANREAFEKELSQYQGTYVIYETLSDAHKDVVYGYSRDGDEIRRIRNRIVGLKLGRYKMPAPASSLSATTSK